MGSFIETKILALPDGSVAVFENGTGAISIYMPNGVETNPEITVNKILEALKKNTEITEKVVSDYKKKLLGDFNKRLKLISRLVVKVKVASNRKFNSITVGGGTILKLKVGWHRILPNGINQYFNESGYLSKIKNSNGNVYKLVYEKRRLKTIQSKIDYFFRWEKDKNRLCTQNSICFRNN